VVLQHTHHFDVVGGLIAENVGEDGGPEASERRQLFLGKGANPDVLEADRIHHPAAGLVEARRRVAFDRLA